MSGSSIRVSKLSPATTERDLQQCFEGYGRITNIYFTSTTQAIVEFDDTEAAESAVNEVNGKTICRKQVAVDQFVMKRTEYRLIGRNLLPSISWQNLKDYVRKAGKVTYANAHRFFPNEGVVEFATYHDMISAIEMLDGTEFGGKRIQLVEHVRMNKPRIEFDDNEAAENPVNEVNGNGICRKQVVVDHFVMKRTEYRLIVKNLSPSVSWQDLKDYVRKAGRVTYADAHRYFPDEGIVEFATYHDMMSAIEMLDDTEFGGQRIRLVEHVRMTTPRSVQHSRNRYRSHRSNRSMRSRSTDSESHIELQSSYRSTSVSLSDFSPRFCSSIVMFDHEPESCDTSAEAGCDYIGSRMELASQHIMCEITTVECPLKFMKCNWLGKITKMPQHCAEVHPNNFHYVSTKEFLISNFAEIQNRRIDMIFNVFGTFFRCTWDMNRESGDVKIAVYHVGNPLICNQFSFGVDIHSASGNSSAVTLGGHIFQMYNYNEQFEGEKYVGIRHGFAKEFCQRDGSLHFTVSILEK